MTRWLRPPMRCGHKCAPRGLAVAGAERGDAGWAYRWHSCAERASPGGVPPWVDVAALRTARLGRTWFARDALVVARALIGCFLVHERGPLEGDARVSRIVETEAYRGPRDLASHARAGLTRRTRTLFGPEGHAYVFFVYGMHECFNVTCLGEGKGHAVLVRAAEARAGLPEETRLDGP